MLWGGKWCIFRAISIKEHGKTLKHEALRSINHKATQNKNNTGTTALERSIFSFKCCLTEVLIIAYLFTLKQPGDGTPALNVMVIRHQITQNNYFHAFVGNNQNHCSLFSLP